MGDVWPANTPGGAGAHYGFVTLSPQGALPVRSLQTFTFVVTIGDYGLDDTGAIKIVRRWTGDGGPLQCDDPGGVNHVTARASNGAELAIYPEPYPHQRPWYNGLRVTLRKGYLSPGETITVVFGDRSGGGPGYRLQTFAETAHPFTVLIDPCATGVFLPIGTPGIDIVPGPAETWVLTAPTLRRPGETFALGLRAEDRWGNATADAPGAGLRVVADGPVTGLPARIDMDPGARAHRIDGLRIAEPGVTRFHLLSGSGDELARSNPLVTREGALAGYWGDLHGQSGETVGIDPIETYIAFARDIACLDVTSHQANDFQVTGAFWAEINAMAAAFNEDGRFVMFPGYEWSGNTPVGGDHNVFFRHEGRPIRRSSHALLEDRSDIDSDAPNLAALFEALSVEDCVLYAHVGGRPADISYAEDARLRTAVEVHSDWGTFEWIMTDAFDLGYRVGLVCNSDGHKGAPGACYPGASEFGAYSGLTCFLADDLSRDGIFDSLRRRHQYGTTGCRMHLDVTAHLGPGSIVHDRDPRLGPSDPRPADTAMMGDIVQTASDSVTLAVTVQAHAPIERVDVLNGAEIVETLRPYTAADLGARLRVIWEGAEYRGRGRTTRWTGTISLDGARIARFAKINAWNHERRFEQTGDAVIAFDAVTTGNFGGCDIWLDARPGSSATIDTTLVRGEVSLDDIGLADMVFDAGGLGRRIRAFRLPELLTEADHDSQTHIPIAPGRDNPLWVRITTEDGFVAWSSPIYVFR
jgi:hypothetical protein